MSYKAAAIAELGNAKKVLGSDPLEDAVIWLIAAETHALLAIHEVLERIDDALRNTIGGRS